MAVATCRSCGRKGPVVSAVLRGQRGLRWWSRRLV